MRRLFFIFTLAFFLLAGQACSISFRTGKVLDGGPYRSDDGGITWAHIVNAGVDNKNKPVRIDAVDVTYIRFDPTNTDTMYLGTIGAGIYRTEDGGANWVHTGLQAGTYPAFAIDPSAPSILYAAAGGTVQKSVDAGATWTVIYLESRPDRSITDITAQPGNTGFLLMGTNTGEVLLSKDYGDTWQLFSTIGQQTLIHRLFFAANSNTVMYAVSLGSGLFISQDTGQNWTSLNPTLVSFPDATNISSVATLDGSPNTLYLASGYGLLRTTDRGQSWQPIQTLVPFNSQPIQLVAVNPQNSNMLYVIVGNRLRKSEDGGANWDAKISIPTSRQISTLILNPEHPERLFVGTVKPRKR